MFWPNVPLFHEPSPLSCAIWIYSSASLLNSKLQKKRDVIQVKNEIICNQNKSNSVEPLYFPLSPPSIEVTQASTYCLLCNSISFPLTHPPPKVTPFKSFRQPPRGLIAHGNSNGSQRNKRRQLPNTHDSHSGATSFLFIHPDRLTQFLSCIIVDHDVNFFPRRNSRMVGTNTGEESAMARPRSGYEPKTRLRRRLSLPLARIVIYSECSKQGSWSFPC